MWQVKGGIRTHKFFAIILIVSCLLTGCSQNRTENLPSLDGSNEEISSSAVDYKPQSFELTFNWAGNGNDPDPQKSVILVCPSEWEPFVSVDRNSKGLSFNVEKFLTLVCYSPDQISQYIESYATEQKKIGSRMFQTIVQEQVLIDTSGEDLPTADTYVIRDYYCSEGGYYYNFCFFQKQNPLSVTVEEIESFLETIQFAS